MLIEFDYCDGLLMCFVVLFCDIICECEVNECIELLVYYDLLIGLFNCMLLCE